jgi:hypothetical protein
MQDIELRIPVELTASRIQRRAAVSEETALKWAIELHGLVSDYRKLFALRPPCEAYTASEETDVVETILRTAVDVWPLDEGAGAAESVWLYERLEAVDGDELYDRYMRLFDKINGTDIAESMARLSRI